jgi:hypothetical protein
MLLDHIPTVEVKASDRDGRWEVVVDDQRTVVVDTEIAAVQIAEELAGWLSRAERRPGSEWRDGVGHP